MEDEDIKTMLKYINLLINQATATADADELFEALDQIQNLIKLHLELLEDL